MSGQDRHDEAIDPRVLRDALRHELTERGLETAGDSHGMRSDIYILGENDLARALFEFKPTVAEACDTMYQGSWVAGLPPRFAVLPASESESPELEMLEQIQVTPVFFSVEDGAVTFRDLDALLAEHLGSRG
jgi:hypothetical protein